MDFNSLAFLLFCLAVLAAYWGSGDWERRKRVVLVASWLFYATWSPRFLAVLVATTWLDFHLARWVHRLRWRPDGTERRRGAAAARRALVLSLAVNLGLLAFFKYGRFLWASVDAILPLPPEPGLFAVAVPLGISFYTFHSISYVVDTWRGLRPPTDRFVDFAVYVAFFPQLLAGPITRWGFFGPQLERPRRADLGMVETAVFFLARGFVKKLVLADSLGALADGVYADPARAPGVEAWLALYAYAFQIYFDFSGYTDLARGLAGLLGFRLPENFRHPYLATSPSDFWRRWHVSLSTWLRDYLYVPLGGNRRGRRRTYANLLLTMLLGGLWHGAAWTFVLWGAYHGIWLGLHRLLVEATGGRAPRTPAWLRRTVTFHLVVLGWVLFRAGSLEAAAALLHGLVAGRPLAGPFPIAVLALVLLGAATHGLALRVDLAAGWRRVPRLVQGAVYGVVVVLVGLFSAQTQRFIYFQF
jgi:D-alanyl-lipoteichoic acid acyltransferase DltB (MBOAT superfamily)